MSISIADLLAKQTAAAAALLEAAQHNLATQQAQAEQLLSALKVSDQNAAVAARNAMWEAVYTLHKQMYAFDEIWNETTPRVGEATS
jgi:hypothetical protein